jgi:hypothetical protein
MSARDARTRTAVPFRGWQTQRPLPGAVVVADSHVTPLGALES